MRRAPLLVAAIVAVVGVALTLLWAVRGADAVAGATAPRTSTPPALSASSSPSRSSPRQSPSEPTPSEPVTTPTTAPPSPPRTTTPPPPPAPVTAEPPPAPAAAPRTGPTLRIPAVDLRARLHSEGLRGGRVNPPAGTVMWFSGHGRVAPGAVGTSVIAGHVAVGGRPDVFADLSDVRVGDRVELTGTDGATRTFRVVRAGVVDKNELTVDQTVWGGNSSVRRLAIVTCDDAFGFRGDGHRVANYVVIAEAV